MKAVYVKLLIVLLIITSSCGTGMYMTSAYVDDAYYNPANQPVVVEKRVLVEKPVAVDPVIVDEPVLKEQELDEGREYFLVDSISEEFVDEDGNVIVNNHYYYEPDEELDYTSRIYRFNRPNYSFGYYNDWYWDDWYWGSYRYNPYGYYGGMMSYYDPYYYRGYIKARTLYSDEKLIDVFRALLKADISIKTTNLDDKTLITILISEIL